MPARLTPAGTGRIIEEQVQQGLPDTPATRLGLDEASCEIPTVPTAIAELHERIETILANAGDIPLKDMAAAAARTLDAVEKIAAPAPSRAQNRRP